METTTPRSPVLTDLLIYPTSRCNLKCRHCYFAPAYESERGRHDDEISCEQICRAIDELLPFGLRTCKLSGGEPFLRDDILDLCRYMNQKNIAINIETNATFITKEIADTLGGLPCASFVAVSIDGVNAETHEALRGVKGCFDKVLEGLKHLVEAGLNVQVIAAAYQNNKSELFQIMDLAAHKGAKSFKVCFIHPIGRGKNLPLLGFEECLDLEQQLSARAPSLGIRYCSSVPISLKSVGHIMGTCALTSRCSIASALALLSDGTITVCGMGRYMKDFRFGRLGQDSLTDVWINHPTLAVIREGVPKRLQGICARCVLRSACLGHCRLENENVTLEHFFDPYPKCVSAEELGLFPASRLISQPKVETPAAV